LRPSIRHFGPSSSGSDELAPDACSDRSFLGRRIRRADRLHTDQRPKSLTAWLHWTLRTVDACRESVRRRSAQMQFNDASMLRPQMVTFNAIDDGLLSPSAAGGRAHLLVRALQRSSDQQRSQHACRRLWRRVR